MGMTSPSAGETSRSPRTPVSPSYPTWRQSALLFLGAAAFYGGCLDYAYNGDSFVYANIVATRAFEEFTIHQGYTLLLWLLQGLLSPFTVAAPEVLAVWIAPIFGAASLVVILHIASHYLAMLAPPEPSIETDVKVQGRIRASAWLAVLIVAVSYRFFFNSTSAEVYMPQTFGLLLSFLLFLRERWAIASIPLLFALHLSTLSAFWCLFYPAVAWQRGWGWRPLMRIGIPTALVYLPFLAWFHQDLLWGERGLLAVQDAQPFVPLTAALNFVIYQAKHYTFSLLLLLPAITMIRRNRELFWVTLALFLPNLIVLSKLEAEDNVFILTLDCFFGIWMTIGAIRLAEAHKHWLPGLLVLLQLLLFLGVNRPWSIDHNRHYATELRLLAKRALNEQAIVVTHWEQRVGLSYFGRDTPVYPLEAGTIFDRTVDVTTADPAALSAVRSASVVYAYDYYKPSTLARYVLPERTLQERAEQYAVHRIVERRFGLKCTLEARGVNDLYRCNSTTDGETAR